MGTIGSPNDFDLVLADGTKLGFMLDRSNGRPNFHEVLSPADRMQTLNVPWVYQHFPKGLGYSVRDPDAHALTDVQSEIHGGYGYGVNIDATQDNLVMPSGAFTEVDRLNAALGTPTCLVEWQGSVVAVMVQGIFRCIGGYDTAMSFMNGVSPATRSYGNAKVYGDYLYVAQRGSSGTNDGIVRYSSAFAETIDQDVLAYFLETAYWVVDNVGDNRLIRVNGPNTLSYLEAGGNPMTLADWITPAPSGIPVGSSAYAIRSLVMLDDVVWPVRADGVWAVDEQQTARNKTPQWQSQWDQLSGAASCPYQHGGVRGIAAGHADGIVFVRVTQQGIETEMLWIDPSLTGSNNSPIRGRCYALMQYQKYLVASIYNHVNDTTYIIFGYPNPAGDPPFIWKGAHRVIPGQIVTAMLVHTPGVGSDFQPRLWFGGQDTTTLAPVFSWMYLPRSSAPLAEIGSGSAYRLTPAWQITFTGNDWGQPASRKIPTHVNLLGDGLGSGNSLALSASTDGGAYASVDAVTTSPGEEFDTTIEAGYVHTFRIDGTGTATVPAIFRSMVVEANIAKKQSAVFEATIIIGPSNRNTADLSGRESQWALLLEAVQAGQQITLYDPMHNELSVFIDPDIRITYAEQSIQGNLPSTNQWARTATLRYLVREQFSRWDSAHWDQSLWAGGD